MAGIVAGIADLGRGSQGIAYTFGRALVVGRETHSHMAVVEDRIVRPVSLFDLVETLRDEEAADAVASHEGKRRLEKVQATERGELVEHQQQAVAPSLGGKVLGQAPPDLLGGTNGQKTGR